MKILVTGATGQLGWELTRSLMPLGDVTALDRTQCDLSRPHGLATLVETRKPDIIVNAAAYTAVDRAETEEDLATVINGQAVSALAQAAAATGALLVHYSTDYVFDGRKTEPYDEDDAVGPVSAYGRSKLFGEEAIRRTRCAHLIFRTSWVYAARGGNFLRTMLRLARERDALRVVADQHGTPNWARNLADMTAHVLKQAVQERATGSFAPGLFHLSAAGATTWCGFAQLIFDEAARAGVLGEKPPPLVHPIRTEDYPTPAQRPRNSRLATHRIAERFCITPPAWSDGVRRCLQEMAAG